MSERDPEGPSRPKSLPHWRVIIDQGITNPEIESWPYQGNGTEEEPFAVVWMDNDPRNPLQWSYSYKWVIVLSSAFSVLGVTFASSAFSGGIRGLVEEFHTSAEVAILGLSLFVLGFAVGPLVSAPLSELYGRQVLFLVTFGCFTFFNAGVPGAQNIWTVLILRFFAGCFGSSPLSNAGGVIADCFSARDRGVAMSIFSAAPFLGPAVGPIIGGFLSESAGWRWLMGFMAAFTGFLWIVNSLIVPETYAPVLLRKRAEKLSKLTGKVYLSKLDIDRGKIVAGEAFKSALLRPWILLFREPIVFILSIYMAIVYGTLYMLFAAYPIVFEEGRGWSEGIQGLAFLAILIGMLFAISYNLFFDNKRYQRLVDKNGGFAPPEARLDTAIIGGIALPIGLFWFAWTNSPTLPWQASVAAGIPFGFGTCLVFLSVMSYLIDTYTIFAASVLAASSILRSCFGAGFPLFTSYMYANLGIHWAASIPAFLALACVPFPFLFYRYGPAIRSSCKYSAEADAFMERIREQSQQRQQQQALEQDSEAEKDVEGDAEKEASERPLDIEDGTETLDDSVTDEPRFAPIQNTKSNREPLSFDDNPYDIDRVNTRESFGGSRSRASSVSSARSRGLSLARSKSYRARKSTK